MPLQVVDPFVVLATILVAGLSFGWLAQQVRLPAVTGQILAGVVMGPGVLALFDDTAIHDLQPLTRFALALIGVTVGAHLNLRRLRNAGRRLVFLLLGEALVTPVVVALALLVTTELSLPLVALMGTLAISTAPATIVALVRESRARGVFVKTLVAAVAINNMLCIFLFEITRTAVGIGLAEGFAGRPGPVSGWWPVLGQALPRLGLAVGLGAGVALGLHLLTARVARPERLATLSFLSILLTYGLAAELALSPLLACLVLGAVQTNVHPARDRVADAVFANFEPAILCVFFTLAGLHFSFEHGARVVEIALVFALARFVAKWLAAGFAMRMAGATERVQRSLGLALVPQAGVAIGLVVLIQEDPAFASLHELFVGVVLVAVTLNEIVGPVLARMALGRSGETGRDRPHLVDFLQEENIVTGFQASSMEQAIEKLTDLLISSHHLEGVGRDALLRSVLEREAQISTCIGGGLAVPHGELPEGFPMVGVMAISRKGLPFEGPDGLRIHCIVLLATPRGERDRHLEVLGALARTFGPENRLQEPLFAARSPAHAYELLYGEEAADFNTLLGEPDAAAVR